MKEVKRFSGVERQVIIVEAIIAVITGSVGYFLKKGEKYYGYSQRTFSDYISIIIPWILFFATLAIIGMIVMHLKSTVIVFSDSVRISAATKNASSITMKKINLPFSSIKNVYAEKQGIFECLVIETGNTSLKILIKSSEEIAMLINQLKN